MQHTHIHTHSHSPSDEVQKHWCGFKDVCVFVCALVRSARCRVIVGVDSPVSDLVDDH